MIERILERLPELEHNRPVQLLLLLAITVVAAALRLYRLGVWSFWIDELYTVNWASVHYGSLANLVDSFSGTMWFPFSIAAISFVLEAGGVSEWSARLVPAIIGILTVPVLYFPTRKLFGAGIALIAALLLAFSPWHIYWSQNARFYTSLLLFSALALFAFYSGLCQRRPLYLLLSLLLFYIAASERLTALLALPVAAYGLVQVRPDFSTLRSRVRRPQFRAYYLVAVPFLAYFLYQAFAYLYLHLAVAFDHVYTYAMVANQANHNPLRLALSVFYQLGIATTSVALLGGVYTVVQKQRRGLFVFAAAAIPVVILLLASPFAFTVDRYVFMTLPFWLILCAIAIKELYTHSVGHGKLLSLAVLFVLLNVSLADNFLYFRHQHGNRPDWRRAAAIIDEERQAGDRIAATHPRVGEYYLHDEVLWINSVTPETATAEDSRLWLVLDESIGWVRPEMARWLRQNGELVSTVEGSMPGKNLSIQIYLYDPGGESSTVRVEE
jgi:4-amino-4-deoxy-L-arabinose transferase-like glycosyltransferase